MVMGFTCWQFGLFSDASLPSIQTVANDRVASATADVVFPGYGAVIMASHYDFTFGCNNGLILSGARATTPWRVTGCSFRKRQAQSIPCSCLGLGDSRIWAGFLVLPRTINRKHH